MLLISLHFTIFITIFVKNFIVSKTTIVNKEFLLKIKLKIVESIDVYISVIKRIIVFILFNYNFFRKTISHCEYYVYNQLNNFNLINFKINYK